MKSLFYIFFTIYTIYLLTLETRAQTTTTTPGPTLPPLQVTTDGEFEDIDASNSYCFRFTWMGVEYDNSTEVNTTCSEFMEERNAEGVPCKQPLVITYDSTEPDLDYLWDNYKSQVACRRAKGQTCAKWSYYFNGEVQNVTYMCTKVFVENEGPLTSGRYTQKINGIDVELKLCESVVGDYKPCNSGIMDYASLFVVILSSLIFAFLY